MLLACLEFISQDSLLEFQMTIIESELPLSHRRCLPRPRNSLQIQAKAGQAAAAVNDFDLLSPFR